VPKLHLDFETRSTVDLRKAGVYAYAQHPATEVLLACWALDDGPVETWFAGNPIPASLFAALADPTVIVAAHNAGFERLMLTHVLSKLGWPVPAIDRWDCTAARAARQALPRSLDGAANALGLRVVKDKVGYALMMRMCKPRDVLEDGTITWWDDAERMHRLAEYCAQDVRVERELDKILKPLSPFLKELWQLTEKINDRGVLLDMDFVDEAIIKSEELRVQIDADMRAVTGGAVKAATNVPQLKAWTQSKGVFVEDVDDESLAKKNIEALLKRTDLPDDVRRALELRLEGAKSSVRKLVAMKNRASEDFRVRGNFVFHGASTGRYAGSGVQVQNLPRKVVKDWEEARNNLEAATLDTLSKMLRGCLIAPPGKTLMWADYAAIEARGVAWLAGADKLVHQFATGGKVYEYMAGQIVNRPPEEIGKDSQERQLGKTVILGAGYGMGAPKFQLTCENQGMAVTAEMAERSIQAYRETFPQIPRLWYGLENAAKSAIESPGKEFKYRLVAYVVRDGWLLCRLPSGRVLYYANPRIEPKKTSWGEMKDVIVYDAVHPLTKQWGPESTWGGKLTENCVQAICLDLIAGAMLCLEHNGLDVILTVHDEVVCEVDEDKADEARMLDLMCRVPEWAKGFPIAAEAKTSRRYGK
jgi:DNA polymerase